jgi:hypothetical protein
MDPERGGSTPEFLGRKTQSRMEEALITVPSGVADAYSKKFVYDLAAHTGAVDEP